jgi:hypothetical protein
MSCAPLFRSSKWGPRIDAEMGGLTVRIGEDVRRCVVFFGVPGPEGIEFGGTSFLVQFDEPPLSFFYDLPPKRWTGLSCF